MHKYVNKYIKKEINKFFVACIIVNNINNKSTKQKYVEISYQRNKLLMSKVIN